MARSVPNENEGIIELLRTVISVNQLSINGPIADLCKELNEDSAEDSSEDSESSGTSETEEGPNEMDIFPRVSSPLKMQDAHLAETQQFLRPIRPEHQQRQRQDQQFEGGELRLLRRSENWMAALQRAAEKPAGSVFIFNSAMANFTMANEMELLAAHII